MRGIQLFGAMAFVMVSSLSFSSNTHLCEGFLPENDLKIPVSVQALTGGGLTEVEFNKALDRVQGDATWAVMQVGGRAFPYARVGQANGIRSDRGR